MVHRSFVLPAPDQRLAQTDPKGRAVDVVACERKRALVEAGRRLRGVHIVRLVAGALQVCARFFLRFLVGAAHVARELRGALVVMRDQVVELALLARVGAHAFEPRAHGAVREPRLIVHAGPVHV